MMKKIMVMGAALALTGCAAIEAVVPQTVAGFRANGIIGAVDGLSGALVAVCEQADGERFRVAVDGLADTVGADSALARVRLARAEACLTAGGAADVTDAVLADEDI